ncbi:TonB-dependent receptor [Algivirga pacifica]|uniref:TonB-dependent receptor n=1 Tax=Algivirga pacifica TaxID=1162670 RepID=A0ABP9CZ25_9BACT
MKRYILLSIFLLLSSSIYAAKITGIVKDGGQKPLPGASVLVPALNMGTVSDVDGNFTLTGLPKGKHLLRVSFIGYTPVEKEVYIEGNTTKAISFVLNEDISQLSTVVINGDSEATARSQQPIQIASLDLAKVKAESTNVVGVLNRTSGVKVRQAGGLGSNATIQLNGLTGRAVRIYYDGIPLELLAGGIQLNNLPVNMIERVDVYKGVMPVEVGTDALAGGINIVSKRGQSSFLDASYEVGSFNTHIGTLNTTKSFDNGFYVGVSGFANYSDNNYKMRVNNLIPETLKVEEIEVRRFHNAHQSAMLNLKAGVQGKKWAEVLEVATSVSQRYDEIQHGVRVRTRPAGEATYEVESFVQNLLYEGRFFDERLKVNYFGNVSKTYSFVNDSTNNLYDWYGNINEEFTLNKGSEILANPSRRKGNNTATAHRLSASYSPWEGHTFNVSNFYAYQHIVGEDPLARKITEDNIDPNTLPSQLSKNILGVSYTSKWLGDALDATLFAKFYSFTNQAVQYDVRGGSKIPDYVVTDDELGYGLGLKYTFSPKFFVRGSFEKAIRIPDSFEVFGDFITIGPNYTLRPEISNNINLGTYYKYGWLSADFNVFLRLQEDLIRLEAGRNENDPSTYINQAAVVSKGMELGLKARPIEGLELGANLTYQEVLVGGESNVTNTNGVGNRIPNIPSFMYNLSAKYQKETPWNKGHRFSVYSYYHFVDEFSLILEGKNINPENLIPTQHQCDAGISYSFVDQGLTTSIQVNNIMDRTLYDNYRVPKPGRHLRLKISYNL